MSQTDDIDDSAAPLIEHLAELRTRLIRSVIAFLIAITVFFIPWQGEFVAAHVLNFLLDPIENTLRSLGDPSPTFQYTSPQEYLFTLFRVSMVFGFGLAFPVIGYQMWRFVAPGLYRQEKNAFMPFLIASPVMFLLGASFAQFVVTPLAMTFLLGFADASSMFTSMLNGGEAVAETSRPTIVFNGKVNESLDITLKFILAFGLCFQLPVLLTLMGKAGLVSSTGLINVRKYAMVGILVLAAVVTPPDVVTQLILFVVVYGLYEISIQLVKRVEKQRKAKLQAEGLWDDEMDEDWDADLNKDQDGEDR
ncbi:twin-arginine translocase subunit TatC [Aliishimia ponticola]|uniref:Sec-independent protein translocase protein TatC n=1 Tax=Aliishimia ponticola TaxID=2499833 RepID=A0A4S4NIR9_9RHOB|nr:twin-arginine translocase subunit TatC [Aliishimia ponticola]THH38795.1 twin-arginine translocase subunit TatC [Aliishimia ponticola]